MSEINQKVEEEYQFPNSEQLNESFETEKKKKKKFILPALSKKKMVILSLASVMTILALYNAFTRLTSNSTKPQSQQNSQLTDTEILEETFVASTTYNAIEESNHVTGELIDNDRINELEYITQQKEDEINLLIANMSTMQRNLESLDSQINTLSANFDRLTQQVILHREQLYELNETNKQQNSGREISYNIQAIIPGRAWLISSEGRVTTVREGSELPEYGTVMGIDSTAGSVLTSSGHIIKYSQKDS